MYYSDVRSSEYFHRANFSNCKWRFVNVIWGTWGLWGRSREHSSIHLCHAHSLMLIVFYYVPKVPTSPLPCFVGISVIVFTPYRAPRSFTFSSSLIGMTYIPWLL